MEMKSRVENAESANANGMVVAIAPRAYSAIHVLSPQATQVAVHLAWGMVVPMGYCTECSVPSDHCVNVL